jgi:RES domain-containing protein
VKAGKVSGLAAVPHTGTWYRAVNPRFTSSAISTTHSKTITSRFSPASPANPFRDLYLAENHLVAMFEAQALFGSPLTPGGVAPHPTASLVTLAIQVQLSFVVDLTKPRRLTQTRKNSPVIGAVINRADPQRPSQVRLERQQRKNLVSNCLRCVLPCRAFSRSQPGFRTTRSWVYLHNASGPEWTTSTYSISGPSGQSQLIQIQYTTVTN